MQCLKSKACESLRAAFSSSAAFGSMRSRAIDLYGAAGLNLRWDRARNSTSFQFAMCVAHAFGRIGMVGIIRSVGIALLGAFAIPVAGISGIVATIMLLVLLTMQESRSFGGFMFFTAACGVCYAAVRTLYGIAKRGRLLVERINLKESLSFNPANMLGHPSPGFLVFDKTNRKIAICNSVTGDYKIHNFEYVLRWHYEWGTGTSISISNQGAYIPGTVMRQPVVENHEYRKSFVLVLEVSDENSPVLKFPMQGEAAAQRWCATLNAVFNG